VVLKCFKWWNFADWVVFCAWQCDDYNL